MDFEDAAVRLARDQSKMRGRRSHHGRGIAISARARKQAEHQKKKQAFLRAEKERTKRNEAHRWRCLHESQRSWNEKSLTASPAASRHLLLAPTSIHGDGDKIALPPSVLHTLTSQDFSPNDAGNPWIFRIGIRNPGYEFPASPLFRVLQAPANDDDMSDHEDEDDDDDEGAQDPRTTRYLDELGHKYLAYTHCTVVEFTQEEGHVGIPRHIAEALLDPKNRHASNQNGADIPTTRTVDPASPAAAKDETDNDSAMETATATEQTPGHLAWGEFDIPNTSLEITAVKLPKGSGCTLVPTEESVRNNFYGLRDVKLVLEQSLVRTRATLSKGDTVSTWHRGKKYDLRVAKVLPSSFRAVTCINTDIEVELGEAAASASVNPDTAAAAAATAGATTGASHTANTESSSPLPKPTTGGNSSGFRLGGGGSRSVAAPQPRDAARNVGATPVSLLPEPPQDQTTGVCTVRIRHSGGHGKRRFAIDTAKARDLFAFASSLTNHEHERAFRLVTRFPRRELVLAAENDDENDDPMDGSSSSSSGNPQHAKLHAESTLGEAGLRQGQELFIVEEL